MGKKRTLSKILFLIILILFTYSIIDVFNSEEIPDILSPTHPALLSICLFFLDLFLLLGAFNFAFKKKVFVKEIFWERGMIFLYFCNLLVLGFEFYNRYDGYELDEMIIVSLIRFFVLFVLSYPTYCYIMLDLKEDKI